MLHIATDGAIDMPDGWQKDYQINVLPINIQIGEKSYVQNVDIDKEGFYKIIEETHVIPKTASPSPNQFMEFYRKIARKGETILSVHVTDRLSGTFAAAKMAAHELAGELNVIPFDSGSGSAALAFMCQEARLLDNAGYALPRILEHLEKIRQRLFIVLTVNTLEFAALSGRIRAFQAVVASFLSIKPVIELRQGLLEIVDKVRTRSRSLDRIVEVVKSRFGQEEINVAVVHAEDPATGNLVIEKVKALLNCKNIIMTELSIAITAHMGPGTIGIVAYPVVD